MEDDPNAPELPETLRREIDEIVDIDANRREMRSQYLLSRYRIGHTDPSECAFGVPGCFCATLPGRKHKEEGER